MWGELSRDERGATVSLLLGLVMLAIVVLYLVITWRSDYLLVFAGMTTFFLLLSAHFASKYLGLRRTLKRRIAARRTGTLVNGAVQRVQPSSLGANNFFSMRVQLALPDGKSITIEDQFIPMAFAERFWTGGRVDVWIDPKQPHLYAIVIDDGRS